MKINATFEQITQLINDKNYTSLGFSANLQNFASEGNHIFVVVDKLGNTFIAEVYYDQETKGIQPPLAQQILHLINLPPPVLIGVAVGMKLSDVFNMCRTNKYLNQAICDNDDFWKRRFIHDFGTKEITEKGFILTPNYWKEKYKNFGRVYLFGANNFGQLGFGPGEVGIDRDIPTEIPGIIAKAVSGGVQYSLILSQDGKVYSFGRNGHGELGLGDSGEGTNRGVPTEIPGLSEIKAISAGYQHSLILSQDGEVYSFGHNNRGQLGLDDYEDRYTPVKIPGLGEIKAISAGYRHSLVLGVDGKVYSFGANLSGQLGFGDIVSRKVPTEIPGLSEIKAISIGNNYSLILDVSGQVYSFGMNASGNLGLGDSMNRYEPTPIPKITAKAISAGYDHSLILSQDGEVYSFGKDQFGKLGLRLKKDVDEVNIPTKILSVALISDVSCGRYHSLLLNTTGQVHSFGMDRLKIPIKFSTIIIGIRAKAISAGDIHSLLITK